MAGKVAGAATRFLILAIDPPTTQAKNMHRFLLPATLTCALFATACAPQQAPVAPVAPEAPEAPAATAVEAPPRQQAARRVAPIPTAEPRRLVIEFTEAEMQEIRDREARARAMRDEAEIARFGKVLTDAERTEVETHGRLLTEEERTQMATEAEEQAATEATAAQEAQAQQAAEAEQAAEEARQRAEEQERARQETLANPPNRLEWLRAAGIVEN